MYIAIDFDGTLVTHSYPHIGHPLMYAIETLKELQQKGHKLILYTMRDSKTLQEAVQYCKDNGVTFWAVNSNPTQRHWTSSPKVYAQLYIDDAALGIPLTYDPTMSDRPFVNWTLVRTLLTERGIL